MFVKFIPYALLSFIAMIVVFLFVNWWAPIFCDSEGWLPKWLKWVGTFDASLDTGWQQHKWDHQWLGKYFDGRYKYLARVRWLYRNHNYGFDYYVLGIPFVAEDWKVVKFEGPWMGKKRIVFFAIDGKGHFNYQAIWWFGRTLKFGWKAWNMYDNINDKFGGQWGPENRIPAVSSM
jgi:hypothetical protein